MAREIGFPSYKLSSVIISLKISVLCKGSSKPYQKAIDCPDGTQFHRIPLMKQQLWVVREVEWGTPGYELWFRMTSRSCHVGDSSTAAIIVTGGFNPTKASLINVHGVSICMVLAEFVV